MARLESLDIPLGTKMPKFILRDPNGVIQVSDYAFGKKGLLIVFTCNHCPYAKAVWPRIIRLGIYAQKNGVNVLAINPNINPDYPDDSPDEMRKKIMNGEFHSRTSLTILKKQRANSKRNVHRIFICLIPGRSSSITAAWMITGRMNRK